MKDEETFLMNVFCERLRAVTSFVCCLQIFWMTGSVLIIVLGMLVVPTLGWRWMIRLSITPSIVLIFLFKVGHPLHHLVKVNHVEFKHHRGFLYSEQTLVPAVYKLNHLFYFKLQK